MLVELSRTQSQPGAKSNPNSPWTVELVSGAIGWWRANYGRYQTELRVHSMVRENAAVQWWTRFLGRPFDFTNAFIQSSGYKFDAVGWIIHPPASH